MFERASSQRRAISAGKRVSLDWQCPVEVSMVAQEIVQCATQVPQAVAPDKQHAQYGPECKAAFRQGSADERGTSQDEEIPETAVEQEAEEGDEVPVHARDGDFVAKRTVERMWKWTSKELPSSLT